MTVYSSIRRPLVAIVLCYGLGTWIGRSFPLPLSGWITLAGLMGIAIACRRFLEHGVPRDRVVRYSLWAAVLVAGWGATSIRQQHGNDMPVACGAPVLIRGTVSDDPISMPGRRHDHVTWRFSLHAEEVRGTDQRLKNCDVDVPMTWYSHERIMRPRYGDRLQAVGKMMSSWRGRHSPGFMMSAGWSDVTVLSRAHGNPLIAMCYRARQDAAERLTIGVSERREHIAVMTALLLGYRHKISRDVRDHFTRTGTLHILAISGLHVGIIALLLSLLLRCCRLSRVYWVILLAPLLIGYTLATGARASAVRACIMALVYFSAPLLGRRWDSLSGLSFSALLILVFRPLQLFDIGFIYSFIVVLGLILICPVFDRWLSPLWRPDPMRAGPLSLARVSAQWCARKLCSLVSVSSAAWLTSVPLTLYFFGRLSPAALFGNLLVVPLAFLIVLSGCLSLVLGACLTALSVPFNLVASWFTALLLGVTRVMSGLPFGSIEVRDFPLACVLLWYALIALWLLVRRRALSGAGRFALLGVGSIDAIRRERVEQQYEDREARR